MILTRTAVARETSRRMRRLDLNTGEDIHRLRLDAGITVTELAYVVDIHRSHLARIEAGAARPSLEVLTAIGVALGADLSLRYFPGSGPRLHDRFQAPMLECMLGCLHDRWSSDLEVTVTQPARGVIDLVLTDRSSPVVVAAEAQSELRRLEQQIRWGTEKADGLASRLEREGRPVSTMVVSRLLILRSTASTRELVRRYEATMSAAYPARTEDVIAALTTSGAPWPGPGIAWIRLEGEDATLLRHPPRGVSLGR
jgi:transcriptional regulator with XRE-family HTH domain